ncbi:DUF192 domain-containing protein [Leadbettera azotonutricia]|uniref:Putative lipoprotein n=1 Tax=Leadbettera azotonutricia (strain ATCC BAA-888 / DSM 13862 / ZAS-9) TaxID=545695 RepID=F5YA70_LEAAZ|nr:DUF192 domain-containing protein [Leadbettera azotonutricia]AEF81714.1 putative lipoprotein [Leadbettera azotonutricia ZAS-9]
MIFKSRFYVRLCLLALIAVSITTGCSAQGNIKFEKRDLTIEGAGGQVAMTIEIARSDEERSRGLMFRKELKDGEGMLFIFERDQVLSFWMKDTLIPLSIAFVSADGRIIEIRDMEPRNLNAVRSSRSARYALEAPQGWFARAGLAPGDKLKL